MFVQLSCAVVDPDAANRQEMSNFLTGNGVNVIAALASLDQLPALLHPSDAPRLALVNIDPVPLDGLRKVGALIRQFPATAFFVMSQTVDASILMEALHLGMREFVPLPVDQEKLL